MTRFFKSSTQDPDHPSLPFDDFHRTRSPAHKLVTLPRTSSHNLSSLFSNKLKGLSFLSFSHRFWSSERKPLCTHSLRKIFNRVYVLKLLDYAPACSSSPNSFSQVRNPETLPWPAHSLHGSYNPISLLGERGQ
jgi:hypothetical protein